MKRRKNAKTSLSRNSNVTGWLAKEIKATIPNSERGSTRSARLWRHDHATGNSLSEIKTALGLRLSHCWQR